MNVAAVVLAAGASRRMGRNKLLIDIGGESLVRRAVRRAIGAGLEPVVVVVGHEPEKVRAGLTGLGCEFALNPDFAGPTSSSLHAGLNALPATCNAAMVMLADMPLVTTKMLQSLVADLQTSGAPLAVSRYGDVFAPPLLFRRALFAELLAWNGEGCGKQVVLQHQHEAAVRNWPADALRDVDTPDDLAALQSLTSLHPDEEPR